jgi:acid phosphatase
MRTTLTALVAAVLLLIVGISHVASSGAATAAKVAPNGGCGHRHSTCTPTPTPTTTAPTSSPATSSTPTSPPPTSSSNSAPPPGQHKVMVIIEENHSRSEAMSGMPHLAAWASQFGQATNYSAITHPSLPNYLAIGGGDTFGITDDNPPSSHPISGPSVFGQTLSAGATAKTYAESMPSNCDLTSSGNYAVKHNEWAYFNDVAERTACNSYDVPMGTTSSGNLLNDLDAGRLPVTGQMTPNLCDDAHDCSLATADTWLSGWVAKLMAGPDYTAGDLTIVITFDEDDSSAANNVAFVVIDPRLHGKTVTSAANHYSLTRWLDSNAGALPLNKAATAADLKSAFGL